jgi:hypothetical protein
LAEDDAPKSAYELILERLRKKDREEGAEERPITEQQRSQIAEIRRVYEAKLAEREILFQSSVRKVHDPAERDILEEEYRRDRERLGAERERKIEAVRGGKG